MTEYGITEGIGKPVLDGIQHVMQNGVDAVGKVLGAALSGLGALLSMIPGVGAVGEAISSVGMIGAKTEMDESRPPIVVKSRAPGPVYEPMTSEIAEQGRAAAPVVTIAASMANYSFSDLGNLAVQASLPNLRSGPSLGSSMAIG